LVSWISDYLSSSIISMASKQSAPNRVLAIGMVDSIHFARWLDATNGMNAEITIFPSGPNRKVHQLIVALLSMNSQRFALSKLMTRLSLPIWLIDRLFGGKLRAFILSALLRARPFDIVHFHEMQSGGYPLTWIPANLLSRSQVFYTPYGSDLFWFQNDAKHLARIRQTLRLVDGIFPECERDGKLARQYGFQGELLASMPAAGTLKFDVSRTMPVSGRTKITVKGYGGTWGRAIHVLHALEAIQDHLLGFEIHLTSVTKDVAKEIKRLQSSSKLNLMPHPKFSLSSEEMKALLTASKFHIALSVSDGFPASLIEALLCGAIPIQSDTACLPDSLVEISPENFVSTQNWGQIGEVLLSLEADPKRLNLLSANFTEWARKQAIEPEEFRSITSKAYGIASS